MYNFFYQLVGKYHYPLFTKMRVFASLRKLCTSMLDIVPMW